MKPQDGQLAPSWTGALCRRAYHVRLPAFVNVMFALVWFMVTESDLTLCVVIRVVSRVSMVLTKYGTRKRRPYCFPTLNVLLTYTDTDRLQDPLGLSARL